MPNQYYSCFASTTVLYLPYLSNVPSTLNTRYHQKYCPFCLFSCSTLLSTRWSNCGKRWKRNQMLQDTGKGIVSFSTVQCCASTTVFLSQFVELPKSLDGFPLPWDSLLPKNSTQEFLLHLPWQKNHTQRSVSPWPQERNNGQPKLLGKLQTHSQPAFLLSRARQIQRVCPSLVGLKETWLLCCWSWFLVRSSTLNIILGRGMLQRAPALRA